MAVIGGGSGLAVLLRGLKRHVGRELGELTGVVTVADDGGSSGRLRRDFGVLPPGDIRNCLVALADDEDLVAKLFQYRFAGGEGLAGHSFGNLFLTALTGITGDFYQAILTAERILSVRGKVLPASLSDVHLVALGRSGREYRGESAIGAAGEPIEELTILPAQAAAFPAAVAALERADLIVLGPGSLYTSLLPNLLIAGIVEAVRRSGAPVVMPLNLMTQPGETDAMDAAAHLAAVRRHAGPDLVTAAIVNESPIAEEALRHYATTGAVPVAVDAAALTAQGVAVVRADLLAEGELIRHHPEKLTRAILDQLMESPRGAAAVGG